MNQRHSISALPSRRARAWSFVAIVVGGLCGGLIGFSLVDLQCSGNCAVARGSGTVIGAVIAAVGVGVMAVITLRALSEWNQINTTSNSPDSTNDNFPQT